MSVYKKIDHFSGSFRYLKDGKLCKATSVPEHVMRQLEVNPVDREIDENYESEPVEKVCIFCGAGTTLGTLINGQTLFRCEEHYYSTNVGQVVQKVRENELQLQT